MGALEKFLAGSFALILVYLLVVNSRGANQVMTGFASSSSDVFKTLQGRG